ncbi:kinesin [Striga asiatica]|uniref:Kinesin n=1 Tax=Striga asiatica TaxID=4170 RepID=A0A5A7R9R2_STRAF|nr:kinesin [Striga asiatica]
MMESETMLKLSHFQRQRKRCIDLAHNVNFALLNFTLLDNNLSVQKLSFTFDKVFMPDASQEDVFVEISQLVQSALDGYKNQSNSNKPFSTNEHHPSCFEMVQAIDIRMHLCIWPNRFRQNRFIPRSLEQVFETRQILQAQGWKYDMQHQIEHALMPHEHKMLESNMQSNTMPMETLTFLI